MRPALFETLRSPWLIAVLFLAAVLPMVLPNYYLHIATLALIYAALASAWNIVGGLTGQISLGHSLFVGTGALLASALFLNFGLNLWAGMLVAAVLSGLLGAAIAAIDFRFRLGHLSFALITLAFAEMGQLNALGSDFLGGASGLFLAKDQGRFLHFEFGGANGYYWACLVLCALCLLVNLLIIHSPLGFFLRAIRDNEDAAQGLGVNLLRNKMLAMTISAVLTSLVGTVFARYESFVDPYMLASPSLTIEVVLLATIGGLGAPFGPVLGALLLVPLGEILRGQLGGMLPGLHLFLYGLAVVVVVFSLPRGIAPSLLTWAQRPRAKRRSVAGGGTVRKVRP